MVNARGGGAIVGGGDRAGVACVAAVGGACGGVWAQGWRVSLLVCVWWGADRQMLGTEGRESKTHLSPRTTTSMTSMTAYPRPIRPCPHSTPHTPRHTNTAPRIAPHTAHTHTRATRYTFSARSPTHQRRIMVSSTSQIKKAVWAFFGEGVQHAWHALAVSLH